MTRPRLPLLAVILAATDLALGIVYVIEPRTRTLSPSLAVARRLSGDRLWIWGLVLAVIGLVAIMKIAWEIQPAWSMSAGVGWHLFFTGSLTWVALHDTHANIAGIPIFASFTALHLLAARKVR